MGKNLKLKTIGLVLLTVWSICILLPSFVDGLPRGFTSFFDKEIVLGTDIRGGAHIVYGIDTNKVVEDKATEIKRDFDAILDEKKIAASVRTPVTPLGAVHIIVDNPADKSKIDKSVLSGYSDVTTAIDCPSEIAAKAVCLRVESDYADGIKDAALAQAVLTIRDRIDGQGVGGASVLRKGSEIIVELPGESNKRIKEIKDIIKKTQKLEFKVVDDGSPYMQKLFAYVKGVNDGTKADADPEIAAYIADHDIRALTDFWTHDSTKKEFSDWYLVAEDQAAVVIPKDAADKYGCPNPKNQPKIECAPSGRQVLERFFVELAAKDPSFVVPDENQIGFEYEEERRGVDRVIPARWKTIYLKKAVELTGSTVSDARVVPDPNTNSPEVSLTLNRYGARRFGELTTENVGKKMAILLNEQVKSAPVLQVPILNGRSSISVGGNTRKDQLREANTLSEVLKTGSLPAPLQEESSAEVGPLLGRDSVRKAQLSFLLGSVLVLLIMVWVYRTSGIISLAALTLNILFMMAALVSLGATLTLPGIAALVLTVGMAVDANIIVYERIREELRQEKSVRGSVDAGFKHGFSAILDGQVTTALAAYVLYSYGSGPIKGFAIMLLIGIGCTLFTAYWCTRLFFDYYVGKKENPVIGI